jgi:guanosine-3',5'-bis(diphosphate) 3'-pyrophosphohydrolase
MELKQITTLLRTLHYAADKHRDQRRKDLDASPYINHPIEVAELLTRLGEISDLVTIQAALLHDTVEDTEATLEDLERHFGPEVRAVVEEVSDDKSLEKAERKRLQVEHAAGLSTRAKLVKLCDKICNVTDITHHPPQGWPLERRRDYLDWTEQVVAGLRGTSEPLEQLYDKTLAHGRQVLEAEGGDR